MHYFHIRRKVGNCTSSSSLLPKRKTFMPPKFHSKSLLMIESIEKCQVPSGIAPSTRVIGLAIRWKRRRLCHSAHVPENTSVDEKRWRPWRRIISTTFPRGKARWAVTQRVQRLHKPPQSFTQNERTLPSTADTRSAHCRTWFWRPGWEKNGGEGNDTKKLLMLRIRGSGSELIAHSKESNFNHFFFYNFERVQSRKLHCTKKCNRIFGKPDNVAIM